MREPEIKKLKIDRIMEAFQWFPDTYHPLVHEINGDKYVVGVDQTKHYLRPGWWVVYDPVYRVATAMQEPQLREFFTAVEIHGPMKSLRASMTPREIRQAGLAR